MPKIRCPSNSASVCRIFPGSRRSTRHRAKPATNPYTRSAAIEQDGAAIGTRVPAVERRDEGLVEEIRKEDSLWYRIDRHVRASVVGKCL